MKILFFMEDYYLGGVDTFVINLINSWPDNSDTIVLVCNHRHSGLGLLSSAIKRPFNLIKHRLLIFTGFFELKSNRKLRDKILKLILKISSPFLRYILLMANIYFLGKLFVKLGADRLMIINGGYPGGDSCRAASIAWGIFRKKDYSIHSIHGIAVKPGYHITLQEHLVDRIVSRFTKKFTAVSNAVIKTMDSRKGLDLENRILCIYNGIELNNYSLHSENGFFNLKIELQIPLNSRLCLMMGGYHCHKHFNKGHEFLIRAFREVIMGIPEAHLLICGYGSEEDKDRIRTMIREFNLQSKIHLSGFRNDIPFLLKNSDLLLISSQTFESFCLAGIEAMANKVPVVATCVGGIPEIILDSQGGYCIKKEDIASYVNCIIALLSNERLRIEQGLKGFQRYRDFFTASRMSKEYADLIKN